nr:hypothetical protein [Caballeronia sp. LZ065]
MKPTLISGAALTAFSLSLAACGGGSGPATSGGVYMGPVANAMVAIHELSADGTPSERPVASTTTASDGTFVLRPTLRYPLLVRVTGGTYQEEATGSNATMTSEIDAVYLNAPSQMIVSAYSNAIVADARAAGGLSADNIAAAIARVNAFAGDIDVQQTAPVFVQAGASTDITDGAKMALALGAESQSRTTAGISITASTMNIVAQSGNGETITDCHAGAGDTAADGTLAASASGNCAITAGAADYVKGARNRSGIASLAALRNVLPGKPDAIIVSSAACNDRDILLAQHGALFKARQDEVQAQTGNNTHGVTAANWKDFANGGSWGPRAATYGAITTTSCSSDVGTFQRELLMAVENYWVDQGINYCHHHVPGWTPPLKFRNSSPGSTSGGGSSGMTCTAYRNRDRSQSLTPLKHDDTNWQGVDCSDFTSWVYNFSGITHEGGNLETGIGTQACSTGADAVSTSGQEQPGVLLDINHDNVTSMLAYLKPGDLLYITATSTVPSGSPLSNVAGAATVSHVVTWTGKRFNDLRNGPEGWRFDPARLGSADSRLGGDLASYLPYPPAELGTGTGDDKNPWMIVDSHYAGPAYRPFVAVTASSKGDWYGQNLSHVRRIIDADAARTDPALASLVIEAHSTGNGAYGKAVTLSSTLGRAGSHAHQWIYQRPSAGGTPQCYRMNTQ